MRLAARLDAQARSQPPNGNISDIDGNVTSNNTKVVTIEQNLATSVISNGNDNYENKDKDSQQQQQHNGDNGTIIHQHEDAIRRLIDQRDAFKSEAVRLNHRVTQLIDDLQKANQSVMLMQEQQPKLDGNDDKHHSDPSATSIAIQEVLIVKEEMDALRHAYSAERHQLEAKINELNSNMMDANRRDAEAKALLLSLGHDVKRKVDDINDMRVYSNEVNEQVREWQHRFQVIDSRHRDTLSGMAEKTAQISILMETIEALQSTNNNSKHANGSGIGSSNGNSDASDDITDVNGPVMSLAAQLSASCSREAASQRLVAQLQENIRAHEGRIHQLNNEMKELSQHHTHQQTLIHEYRSSDKKWHDHIDTLESQISSLTTQLQSLRHQLTTANDELHHHQHDIDAARRVIDDITHQNEHLQMTIDKSNDECRRLTHQLQQMEHAQTTLLPKSNGNDVGTNSSSVEHMASISRIGSASSTAPSPAHHPCPPTTTIDSLPQSASSSTQSSIPSSSIQAGVAIDVKPYVGIPVLLMVATSINDKPSLITPTPLISGVTLSSSSPRTTLLPGVATELNSQSLASITRSHEESVIQSNDVSSMTDNGKNNNDTNEVNTNERKDDSKTILHQMESINQLKADHNHQSSELASLRSLLAAHSLTIGQQQQEIAKLSADHHSVHQIATIASTSLGNALSTENVGSSEATILDVTTSLLAPVSISSTSSVSASATSAGGVAVAPQLTSNEGEGKRPLPASIAPPSKVEVNKENRRHARERTSSISSLSSSNRNGSGNVGTRTAARAKASATKRRQTLQGQHDHGHGVNDDSTQKGDQHRRSSLSLSLHRPKKSSTQRHPSPAAIANEPTHDHDSSIAATNVPSSSSSSSSLASSTSQQIINEMNTVNRVETLERIVTSLQEENKQLVLSANRRVPSPSSHNANDTSHITPTSTILATEPQTSSSLSPSSIADELAALESKQKAVTRMSREMEQRAIAAERRVNDLLYRIQREKGRTQRWKIEAKVITNSNDPSEKGIHCHVDGVGVTHMLHNSDNTNNFSNSNRLSKVKNINGSENKSKPLLTALSEADKPLTMITVVNNIEMTNTNGNDAAPPSHHVEATLPTTPMVALPPSESLSTSSLSRINGKEMDAIEKELSIVRSQLSATHSKLLTEQSTSSDLRLSNDELNIRIARLQLDIGGQQQLVNELSGRLRIAAEAEMAANSKVREYSARLCEQQSLSLPLSCDQCRVSKRHIEQLIEESERLRLLLENNNDNHNKLISEHKQQMNRMKDEHDQQMNDIKLQLVASDNEVKRYHHEIASINDHNKQNEYMLNETRRSHAEATTRALLATQEQQRLLAELSMLQHDVARQLAEAAKLRQHDQHQHELTIKQLSHEFTSYRQHHEAFIASLDDHHRQHYRIHQYQSKIGTAHHGSTTSPSNVASSSVVSSLLAPSDPISVHHDHGDIKDEAKVIRSNVREQPRSGSNKNTKNKSGSVPKKAKKGIRRSPSTLTSNGSTKSHATRASSITIEAPKSSVGEGEGLGMDTEINQLRNRIGHLELLLHRSNDQYERSRQEISLLNATIAERDAMVATLEVRISTIKSRLREQKQLTNSTSTAAKNEIARMSSKLHSEEEWQSMLLSIANGKELLRVARQEIARKSKLLQINKEMEANAATQLITLAADNDSKDHRITLLSKQVISKDGLINELRQRMATGDTIDTITQLRNDIQRFSERINDLTSANLRKDNHIKDLKSRIETLTKVNNDHINECPQLLDKARENIRRLQRDIERRDHQLNQMKPSSGGLDIKNLDNGNGNSNGDDEKLHKLHNKLKKMSDSSSQNEKRASIAIYLLQQIADHQIATIER
jgi:chromosome segregation ATPase